ncbi:pentapeptide repeat-containing protein [Candidatus Omnitrophota bacterium]
MENTPGENLMSGIACSYERCHEKVWRHSEGEKPLCIFHSDKIDEKREEFAGAWEAYLEKQLVLEDKYFNLKCNGFIFPDNVIFSGKSFSGHTYFVDVTFSGHTYFNGVTFSGHMYFNGAKFLGKAYFNVTTFSGKAYFDNTSFSLNADFNGAIFMWDTFFDNAVFMDVVGFDNVSFKGEASFKRTVFTANADFINASFENKAHFINSQFKQEGIFTSSSFYGADLSSSNFTRCSFKNVENGIHYNLEHIYWKKPRKWWRLWEYSRLKEPIPPTKFTDIDTSGIIAASNRQFVQDMADQQYIVQFKAQHKFWYYVWLTTCDCGRSFWRFLFWCIVVAGTFGIIYKIAGERWFDNTTEWNELTPFYYSFVTFLRLGFGAISPRLGSGWAQLAVTFEVFVGYIGLGGLISIFSNILARRA